MDDKKSKQVEKKLGGAREGAGRPKGSSTKLTAQSILEEAQGILGKPLVISLLEGYAVTIADDDRKHRVIYEKMLLDKVASQLVDVDIDESSTVENRQVAFLKALETIGTVALPPPANKD